MATSAASTNQLQGLVIEKLRRGHRFVTMTDDGRPLLLTHVPAGNCYGRKSPACYLLRVGLPGEAELAAFMIAEDAAVALVTRFPAVVVEAALTGPSL